MTKLEQQKLSNLERELVKAIVGRLGGSFHKAIVVSKITAKIAVQLAEKAYHVGRLNMGRDGDTTFKQFIQDYE